MSFSFFRFDNKLSPQAESALLENALLHDGEIRNFFINSRILLYGQPKKNFPALKKYIQTSLAPKLARKYCTMHGVILSGAFGDALEKTLLNAIENNNYANHVVMDLHKTILSRVASHLPYLTSLNLIQVQQMHITRFAESIPEFFEQEAAREIFDKQWKDLIHFHAGLYTFQQRHPSPWVAKTTLMSAVLWGGGAVSFPLAATVFALFNYELFHDFTFGILTLFQTMTKMILGEKLAEEIQRMHDCLCAFKKISTISSNTAVEAVRPLAIEFSVPTVASDSKKLAEPVEPEQKEEKQKKVKSPASSVVPQVQAPVQIKPQMISFTNLVNYSAEYNPSNVKNSTIFPISRSVLQDTFYVALHPELSREMTSGEWKKCQQLIQQTRFVGPQGQQGIKSLGIFIEDPATREQLMCYELKLLGAYGDSRLLGVIRAREEINGKMCILLEFNTYCAGAHQPHKLARSVQNISVSPVASKRV